MTRANHGSYLFQRPGSANWWIRLRSPGKTVARSLGTSDRREAEIVALPLIGDHKTALLAARPRFEVSWWHAYEPGREHVAPDGGKILATDRQLFYIGQDGAIIRTEPNGALQYRHPIRGKEPSFEQFDRERERVAPPPTKNTDDAIIDTYLRHAGVSGADERNTRGVWELFRSLCPDTPLKDATRDDGRRLVERYTADGLKSVSISRKLKGISAAVNLAIREGKLKFNPFASIAPHGDDSERRLPLDDADMKAIKANIGTLDKSDQLLLRLLGSTGMRLSEAMAVNSEQTERGCRFVVIGTKTEQSLRRVPLPSAVLPFLPPAIKGALFKGSPNTTSNRLMKFLRDDCGIVDPRKVLHSLRHRAADRLRAAGAPEGVRWELLGHEKKTVAASYGAGSPVPLLKKWIDKIGF
jgi:integrase